jgi:hypothetical protein
MLIKTKQAKRVLNKNNRDLCITILCSFNKNMVYIPHFVLLFSLNLLSKVLLLIITSVI